MTVAVTPKVSQLISLSDADDPMIGYVPLRALYSMFSRAGGNCTGVATGGGYTARVYWQENTLLVAAEGGLPIKLDELYGRLEVTMIRQSCNRFWPVGIFKTKAEAAIDTFAENFRAEIHEQAHQPVPELTMLVHVGAEHASEHHARLQLTNDEVMAGFYVCSDQCHGFIDDEDLVRVPLNPFWP